MNHAKEFLLTAWTLGGLCLGAWLGLGFSMITMTVETGFNPIWIGAGATAGLPCAWAVVWWQIRSAEKAKETT